jgi:hypothetical protein
MSVGAAIALGIGTLLAGAYSSEQQSEAQAGANEINLQIEREKAAEAARQFDLGLRTQQEQFGYQSGQEEARFGQQQTRADELARSRIGRFDLLRGENIGRLDPYSQAAQSAVTERSALMGLSGADAQREAFSRFSDSPGQQFLRDKQERALLRSGSKIGALGGGNIRTALQEQAFSRAQTDYDRQLARLSGVAGEGLQAEGLVASLGTGPDVGVGTSRYQQYGAYDPSDPTPYEPGTGVPTTGGGGSKLPPKEAWYDPRATGDFLGGKIMDPGAIPTPLEVDYDPRNYPLAGTGGTPADPLDIGGKTGLW